MKCIEQFQLAVSFSQTSGRDKTKIDSSRISEIFNQGLLHDPLLRNNLISAKELRKNNNLKVFSSIFKQPFTHIVDRYTEIERENRILLEKMTQIMNNKNKLRNS